MSSPQPTPDKPLTPQEAWQPFTPRGVAAFGTATLTRLLLAQLAVGLIIAFALIWFLRAAYVPVINEAIMRLPDTSEIRQGQLNFTGESPQRLAENSRLALVIDVAGSREAGHVADLEVTFEKTRAVARGPFGAWWRDYDPNYVIMFNRPQLIPAWDAWRWAALALSGLGFALVIFASWWALSLIYTPLVKFIAFFADRTVTWQGAWKLSAAALLPGALLVALALVLYGYGAVDLIRFGLLWALHLVAGLIFACTSPFFLPKFVAVTAPKNPFDLPGVKKDI